MAQAGAADDEDLRRRLPQADADGAEAGAATRRAPSSASRWRGRIELPAAEIGAVLSLLAGLGAEVDAPQLLDDLAIVEAGCRPSGCTACRSTCRGSPAARPRSRPASAAISPYTAASRSAASDRSGGWGRWPTQLVRAQLCQGQGQVTVFGCRCRAGARIAGKGRAGHELLTGRKVVLRRTGQLTRPGECAYSLPRILQIGLCARLAARGLLSGPLPGSGSCSGWSPARCIGAALVLLLPRKEPPRCPPGAAIATSLPS